MTGKITYENDPFWFNNYRILFDSNRLVEFYPSADMTYNEKLNAIARFFIFSGVILIVYYRGNTNWPIYMTLTGLFLTYIMYRYRSNGLHANSHDDVIINDGDTSNGNDNGTENGTGNGNTERNFKCTGPTQDNPFMNPTVNEIIDNPTRSEACDYTDPDVYKELEDHFNYNLYKDVDDLFNKNNSQREFHTVPSTTIPNDQNSFANWLYGTGKTCKEDSDSCMRYEDVRANRKPVNNFDHNADNLYGI